MPKKKWYLATAAERAIIQREYPRGTSTLKIAEMCSKTGPQSRTRKFVVRIANEMGLYRRTPAEPGGWSVMHISFRKGALARMKERAKELDKSSLRAYIRYLIDKDLGRLP